MSEIRQRRLEEAEARRLFKQIRNEKSREILFGRNWILLNSDIPVAQLTDGEMKMLVREATEKMSGIPEYVSARKLRVTPTGKVESSSYTSTELEREFR